MVGKELDSPPIEGNVVHPRGIKVGELIEELSKLDKNAAVVVASCYCEHVLLDEIIVSKASDDDVKYLLRGSFVNEGDEFVWLGY